MCFVNWQGWLDLIRRCCFFAIQFFLALLVWQGVYFLLQLFLFFPGESDAAKTIYWETATSLTQQIKLFLFSWGYAYFYSGLLNFGIFMSIFAAILLFILAFRVGIAKLPIFLLFVCAFFSLYSLSFLQGLAQLYRHCQPFAFFVAFAWLLFFAIPHKKFWTVTFSVLAAFFVYFQAKEYNEMVLFSYYVSNEYTKQQDNLEKELKACYESVENKSIVLVGLPTFQRPENYLAPVLPYYPQLPRVQIDTNQQLTSTSGAMTRWSWNTLFMARSRLKDVHFAEKEETDVYRFVDEQAMPVWPAPGSIREDPSGRIIVHLSRNHVNYTNEVDNVLIWHHAMTQFQKDWKDFLNGQSKEDSGFLLHRKSMFLHKYSFPEMSSN